MKVFISGPMSGKPNYNREAFFKAEEELEKHGYSVWNPAWLAYPSDTEFTKDDMHIIDFAALRRCDAIYMLKGWKHSKGAQEECEYAIMRGLMIMYEGVHCWGKEPEDEHDVIKRHIKNVEEALAWERWKNRLPDRLDITSKHPRVTKPIDDCFSMYDYIGPKLEKEVNNVNQAINDVEADLDNFKDETDGKMDDIYDTLHRHGENIDTCQNDIDTCLNDMDCLRRICNNRHADNVNKINALKKEVESIKESIGTDNLQEQLEKDFSDVYEEFQDTKDKVNDIEFGYIDWSSKMSSAIDEMEKVKDTLKSLNSLVVTLGERNGVLSDDIYKLQRVIISSDIENISIKDMNQKLIDLGRELDVYIDDYKEAYKHLNNADDALERRIKAIEKRLSIKPFYEPTEDEKDD